MRKNRSLPLKPLQKKGGLVGIDVESSEGNVLAALLQFVKAQLKLNFLSFTISLQDMQYSQMYTLMQNRNLQSGHDIDYIKKGKQKERGFLPPLKAWVSTSLNT